MERHGDRLDGRITELAATQQLCFARRQVLGLGGTPSRVTRRLRAGRWLRFHPGVYALALSSDPWLQRVWAARLAVGDPCWVSHSSAAAIHLFPGYPRGDRLELTSPHGAHPRVAGAFVHQIDDVRPEHLVTDLAACPGLPVTSIARTVVDLSAGASAPRLASTITELITARRLDPTSLGGTLASVARRGKPGVRRLGRVIDQLAGAPVAASVAEAAFYALLVARGVPLPRPQVPLPGRGAVPGIADGLYPAERVIVEVDSRRWHGRYSDIARDRLRDAEAARAGYLTLRFLYEHVVADPDWVVQTLRDVLGQRAAALRRAG